MLKEYRKPLFSVDIFDETIVLYSSGEKEDKDVDIEWNPEW